MPTPVDNLVPRRTCGHNLARTRVRDWTSLRRVGRPPAGRPDTPPAGGRSGQAVLPTPTMPSTATAVRPGSVVHPSGASVVKATTPCAPSPTGTAVLVEETVWVAGAVPDGEALPGTKVAVMLSTTVPVSDTA